MNLWEQELALVERAALRIEAMEAVAEQRVDAAFAEAEVSGCDPRKTLEFEQWLAARADTDAAWGRWAEVMHARPAAPTAAMAGSAP
jgi:hypothetical protein